MTRWRLILPVALALALAGCSAKHETRPPTPTPLSTTATPDDAATLPNPDDPDLLDIVVAPGVKGDVDQTLVREAFRRAVAQGQKDFGIRNEQTVVVYIDPDSAIGLEDALGLSAKNAIHLRAGRTKSMTALLPLMMHEYTHTLQWSIGRLRPQWWVEGQADHQSLRVQPPTDAARQRAGLYADLARDVKSGKAPDLSLLRSGTMWDEYIKKAGAGKAYGWGNAAVSFIEDKAGFDAVARIMTDKTGPNTLGSFDQAVQRETGLDPAAFDAALKSWVTGQARG